MPDRLRRVRGFRRLGGGGSCDGLGGCGSRCDVLGTAAEVPKPAAASAAERAEAALRPATESSGLFALEVALAAAPREVREGGVGAEARDRCDRLLEAQQEAERKAKQEAAAESAWLAAAEQVQEAAAREAGRAAATSKAREVAAVVAAAAGSSAPAQPAGGGARRLAFATLLAVKLRPARAPVHCTVHSSSLSSSV